MTKLKICGMMHEDDVAFCCKAGVDILGFVVEYPTSVPWNLARESAAPLIARVDNRTKSCMVTGGEREKILALARMLHPDFIQLHYRESFDDTCFLTNSLMKLGIAVIKAIPVRSDGSYDLSEFASPEEAAKELSAAGVDMLLLDSRCADSPQAGSRKLNFDLYERVCRASSVPVVLAGGLCSRCLGEVIRLFSPPAVDILTAAEYSPGVKHRGEIRKLVDIVSRGR
ncbi:MAG: hypothetical protein AB7D36_04375 [Oscillospiraceae bacterium]